MWSASVLPLSWLLSPVFPPLIAAACPQFAVIDAPGVLCEDFDSTLRNGIAGMQWSRLPVGIDPQDPGLALGDPSDDVLGYAQGTGPGPAGTGGRLCAGDAVYNRPTCTVPVAEENDWHLHTAVAADNSDPGMNEGYQPVAGSTSYAPEGGKAHRGLRSMHMGRHTNVFAGTLGDTLRFRQVSAFVLDPPVNLGPSSSLEFWQIARMPFSRDTGIPEPLVVGGGQVHISLLGADGRFEKWRRLTPGFNPYNYVLQSSATICEFDPDDDQNPPGDETMCNSAVWYNMGDVIGTDATCLTDTDGNDPSDKDCGDIISCNGNMGGEPWPAPGGENCTENGSLGAGVWARSAFDLSPFAGRRARLRWIGTMGGGWSFGVSRSFLEPPEGDPVYQYFEQDDGWWIDDIVLTDLRTDPLDCATDFDGDGVGFCADCDKDDAGIWATPGEARMLHFADDETLVWSAPDQPGGTLPLYDTIRSGNPSYFFSSGTTCIESNDGADTTASDPEVPPVDTVFNYLVRAENSCPGPPGPLGTRSSGVERTARGCN